jgi:hypothetical protein
MSRLRQHPLIAALAGLAVLGLILFVGYAVYLAGVAGELPWQVDPTRIPVTPFADIPGFSAPTPLPTAAP